MVIGRKSPPLDIWARHCRPHQHPRPEEADSIEPVSGLPCSLIDVFSTIKDDSNDHDINAALRQLWAWPGYPGEPLQCQLWEAHRFAGILDARRRRETAQPTSWPTSRDDNVSNSLVLHRLVSAIDALHRGVDKAEVGHLLVANALLYPIWHASIEIISILDTDAKRSELMNGWWAALSEKESLGWVENLRGLFEAYRETRRKGLSVHIDEVARERNVETALF